MTSHVGRYPVDAVLGSGSYGTVYRGRDPSSGNVVAIKVLDGGDAELLKRLDVEAAAMIRVDDEHCVRVIDIVREPSLAALVTEYVDGAPLRAVLAKARRLTGPQALDVIRGALLGLIAVHAGGLVHGDIKPDNILVDRRGRARLIDFGLAHPPGGARGGAWSGSPAYMSPEQVCGDPVDARSDLYSCAAVLYELLTGRRPFASGDAQTVMRAHVNGAVPDPRMFEPSLSAELSHVCLRGLAKAPDQRYPSAREFLAELEDAARQRYGPAWLTGLGTGALVGAVLATQVGTTEHAASSAGRRGLRRPRGWAVTAGAVGVAAVVAIAVVLIDHRSSPSSQPGGQARPILYTVRGVGLRIGSAKALRIGLVSADGARAHLLPQLNILCCIGEALSPDGRRVALSEEHALYTVAADGTDARTVYASPTSTPSVIAWSPDGTRIAFSTGSALDVIRPDGTGLRQVAVVADVTALAWSPNGDRIAYLTKGRPEILAVSATGGQVATLYGRDQREPATLIPATLSWAPGRAILFGTTSQRVVWSYTLGAPRATRALVGADQASWGPDGRTFAALVGGRIVLDVPGEPHGPPIGPSGILSISWG